MTPEPAWGVQEVNYLNSVQHSTLFEIMLHHAVTVQNQSSIISCAVFIGQVSRPGNVQLHTQPVPSSAVNCHQIQNSPSSLPCSTPLPSSPLPSHQLVPCSFLPARTAINSNTPVLSISRESRKKLLLQLLHYCQCFTTTFQRLPHLSFYRSDSLLVAQPTMSEH